MLKFLKLLVTLWLCKRIVLFYTLKYLGGKDMMHATYLNVVRTKLCICLYV